MENKTNKKKRILCKARNILFTHLQIYRKKISLKRKTFSNENGWKNMYFALALFLSFS